MSRTVIAALLVAGVVIIIAALLFVSQSQTLSEAQNNLQAAQSTGTAQADYLNVQATLGAQSLGQAVEAGATAQAQAVSQAQDEAATSQAEALVEAGSEAATLQAEALNEAANVAATTQAQALGEAADAAATVQTEALATAAAQAAEEQAQALEEAQNEAATVQAQAEATQAAFQQGLATSQAESADLENQVEGLAATTTAQTGALTAAAATAQALLATVQAQADQIAAGESTATLSDQPAADVEIDRLLYWEEFDEGSSWATGATDQGTSAFLLNGQYVIAAPAGTNLLVSNFPSVGDGYVEAQMFLDDCGGDGYVALLLRVQNTDGQYAFILSCDLEIWGIAVFYTNADPVILTTNPIVLGDRDLPESHLLGALVQGDTLTLYLDGVEMGSVTDDTFSEGDLGLYVEGTNEAAIVRFDNLRVWSLADEGSSAPPTEEVAAEIPSTSAEEALSIGLVTDGEIDDYSFNQLAWAGVQAAAEEYGAASGYVETRSGGDYAASITELADNGYDVIVTVGFAMGEATAQVAQDYPDVYFVGVDQYQGQEYPNLVGLIFHEDQQGYLAGYLAGRLTENNAVAGVYATNQIPPVVAFATGFENGALAANPDVEVLTIYHPGDLATSFTDPTWGAEAAAQAIDLGADVIFAAGGRTADGALTETATHSGGNDALYCIGVDFDQWETLPEAQSCLVSSATKLVSQGLLEIMALVDKDTPPTGNYYGPVGLAPFHDFESAIPDNLGQELENLATQLRAGEVETGYVP